MIKISFGNHQFDALREECPMCGGTESIPLLRVENDSRIISDLHMDKCSTCGTCFFTDSEPVLGYNYSGFEQNYWYNYVQNGAGISAMLEPLLAVNRPRTGSLLDIGCGFGFVPHFWQSMGFGDAIGLEMSTYGKIGAEKLGINIVPKYYADATELHSRKFDYVFSSEVIEHVENPEAFVTEISSALSEDGILVLTTPSATVLNSNADYLTVLATLSPGFHFFISSASAMKDLLNRCGFDHVEVRDTGHRLFAWASKKELPNLAEGFFDWPIYLDYLEKLSQSDDLHVACGALYRAIKDSYNLGMFDRADALYPVFKEKALKQYDVDFDQVEDILERVRARTDLNNEVNPSWLGCSLLYVGLMEARMGASLTKQIDLLSASIETMYKEIELAAQFAGEPAFFIRMAKQKHKKARQKYAQESGGLGDSNHSYILKHPGSLIEKDICLFAAYASQGKLTESVSDSIKAFCSEGLTVVLCLAVDDSIADFDLTNIPEISGVIVRENGGFDFASWSCGVRLLPECWGAHSIIFVNDSVFVLPNLLPKFLNTVRRESADFVAATESFQYTHHSQSYFMMFQGAALHSEGLRNYWNGVSCLGHKQEVIFEHELKLFSRIVNEYGLSARILFPMQEVFPDTRLDEYGRLNISHTYWDYLVYSGLPFVKVELIRDNPVRANILHWKKLFTDFGASVDDAVVHISTPRMMIPASIADGQSLKASGKPKRVTVRSELREILSELNRVRLNARKRWKLRRQQQK